MLDPYLAPAYLKLRQQQRQQKQQQGASDAAGVTDSVGAAPPPAKRRRRSRQFLARQQGLGVAGAGEAAASSAAEEEEAAAAEAAAMEHLGELSGRGLSRDGPLGPWLRQLLLQREGQGWALPLPLHDRVWELAQRWGELDAWQARLAAACSAAGLAPPRHRAEWLPLATSGWCTVFQARSTHTLRCYCCCVVAVVLARLIYHSLEVRMCCG